MDLKEVTIIVPTKNEAVNIVGLLDSIPSEIQVIVVDASSDHTRAVIAAHRPRHTYILQDCGNIAQARQLGVSHAFTPWILFTDADMVFDANYFPMLALVQLEECIGAVIGAKLSLQRYRTYYRLFSLWMRVLCRMGIPAGSGSNLLIRRDVLHRVGGVDTRLICNEDSELTWRIHRRGYQVLYDDRLKVYECDHRRLDAGVGYKTMHSLIRCAGLFFGWLPDRVRLRDWGYWRRAAVRESASG